MNKKEVVSNLTELDCKNVFVIIRSVSRSGLSRRLDFYVNDLDGPYKISHLIAELLDLKYAPDKGVLVHGCGMDMVFHTLDCANEVIKSVAGIDKFFDANHYKLL